MSNEICLPAIQVNTYIAVPLQRVYEALTTASVWDAWFTQGMEVDPRPGGAILFRWVEAQVDRYTATSGGPVLEADPPRRVVFDTAGTTVEDGGQVFDAFRDALGRQGIAVTKADLPALLAQQTTADQ